MESAFDVQFVEETRKENDKTEVKRKTSADPDETKSLGASNKRLKTAESGW